MKEARCKRQTSAGKVVEKRNPSALLVGMQTGAATVGNSMEFPQKLKMELPFNSATLLLGLYLKNPESPIQKNLCTPMFIAVLFTIVKCWKQSKCPSANEWIKKTVVHLHNGIRHSRKKEGTATFSDIMDGTGQYYVKCNNPVRGRQTPYDLTYKRNLMNKITNEQNRTRGMETWNRLTVTTGEWGGRY